MKSSEHRKIAREVLKPNWGFAIGMVFLTIVIPMMINFIPILGQIFLIILAPAFNYIPAQMYLKLKRKEDIQLTDFFKYTFSKHLWKCWRVTLYVGLILMLVTFISFAVTMFISQIINFPSALENIIPYIMTFICFIIIYYFTFKYSQAAYIIIDEPELKSREIAKKSSELMKGNMIKFLCLYLSFIGWILLSVITFGLAYFYVIPYLYTALASFYDDLLGNKEITIE